MGNQLCYCLTTNQGLTRWPYSWPVQGSLLEWTIYFIQLVTHQEIVRLKINPIWHGSPLGEFSQIFSLINFGLSKFVKMVAEQPPNQKFLREILDLLHVELIIFAYLCVKWHFKLPVTYIWIFGFVSMRNWKITRYPTTVGYP